jgi:hypothetical protein
MVNRENVPQIEPEVHYRDRAGAPIGQDRWVELRRDPEYCRVTETRVRGTSAVVRTVWEGIASPVSPMFATGVSFDRGETFRTPLNGEAARTEEEALAQHKRVVADVKRARARAEATQ